MAFSRVRLSSLCYDNTSPSLRHTNGYRVLESKTRAVCPFPFRLSHNFLSRTFPFPSLFLFALKIKPHLFPLQANISRPKREKEGRNRAKEPLQKKPAISRKSSSIHRIELRKKAGESGRVRGFDKAFSWIERARVFGASESFLRARFSAFFLFLERSLSLSFLK